MKLAVIPILLFFSTVYSCIADEKNHSSQPSVENHESKIAQPGKDQAQSDSGNSQQQEHPSYWIQFLRFCDRYNGAITAIATIFMAIITFLLAFYTWKLWDTSKRALIAYVYVSDAVIRQLIGNDEIHAIVEMRNSGQTPAYHIKRRSEVWLAPHPSSHISEVPFSDSPRSGIGPNDPVQIRADSDFIPTEDEMEKLYGGELAIYFLVELQYRDIFGRKHVTPYKGYYRNTDNLFRFNRDMTPTRAEDSKPCT